MLRYCIKGNAAVMKCKIPSFVADFVHVDAWINVEDGTVLTPSNESSAYGYFHSLISFSHYFPLALSTCVFVYITREEEEKKKEASSCCLLSIQED